MEILRKVLKKICYSGIIPKWFLRFIDNSVQLLAMYVPSNSLRILLNRLRGVKIGKKVYISPDALLGNHPWLLTLEDNIMIGAGAKILTHDTSFTGVGGKDLAGETKIGKNSFIGENAVILPGVTIGKDVIVGAGAVVGNDIPDGFVAIGNPARCIKKTEEGLKDLNKKFEQDKFFHTW